MVLEPNTIISIVLGFFSTLVGSFIIWFLKDNTESNRKLREDVIILRTQLEPIKNAVQDIPALKDQWSKQDLRIKKIEYKLNVAGSDL